MEFAEIKDEHSDMFILYLTNNIFINEINCKKLF